MSTPDDVMSVREALMADAERISHVGSWTWSVDDNTVHWSDNLFRLCGFEPNAFAPTLETFFDLIHPDDLERVRAESAEIAATGIAPESRYRIVRPDGAVRLFLAEGRAVRSEDGEMLRMIGVLTDLTHRDEQEMALKRAKDSLDDAQRIANVGSFTWNRDTQTTTWSAQIRHMCQLSPNEEPSRERLEGLLHPRERSMTLEKLKEFTDESAAPVEARLQLDDGTIRSVAIQLRRRGADVTGVVHDVTDRRQLEEQLRWAVALESTGRLAAGIAHDFNNLLTVITLSAEVARRGHSLRAAEEIIAAANSGAELVRGLLAFARTGSGSGVLELCGTVTDAAGWIDRVSGDDVVVNVALPSHPVYVRGNAAEIQQILLNLTTNARDAMPDGGEISMSVRETSDARATLEFTDTGVGMDGETRARAFDAFFSTKSVDNRGSGLGLSMVYGVVTRLGGNVTLHSEPGEGASVHIELPRVAAPPSAFPSMVPEEEPGCVGRLLVVEDDSAVLRGTVRVLADAGHTVLSAVGPLEAIRVLEESDVDLVLTDVSMPHGGGLRVASVLAELKPSVPIVFMSGHARGAVDLPGPLLAKPFTRQRLVEVVGERLAAAKGERD